MKTLIMIIAITFTSIGANAQVINFDYDSNGNRIVRYESPNFTGEDQEEDSIENRSIADSKINLYPNPVSEILTVELISEVNKDDSNSVTIFNTLGLVVLQEKVSNKSNQIDVSNLISGSYYLQINQGKKTFHQVLIKL